MNTVNRILDLLDKKRIPQKELANELGFKEGNISDWKNGRTKSYKKYIYQIAEYLDTSVQYLLCETDDPNPSADKSQSNIFDNRSISGGMVLQGTNNSGTLTINGSQKELSGEVIELIRIYDSLDVKRRHKLMEMAFRLEEEMSNSR